MAIVQVLFTELTNKIKMEYKGKLYGKMGNTYFPLLHTTDDWEHLENKVEELESVVNKTCTIGGVINWVAVEDELPPMLETIWISNGKDWTDLGCRVETNEGWHWAGQNGIIYQEKDQIVAECESDDLDVMYWCKLPKPPCL